MSTVTTRIDNFIGGVFAASAAGATEAILNPATGEVIADAPLSARPTSTRPSRRRTAHSTAGPRRRPASARWRCCGSRTRSRSARDELAGSSR